ncbi:type IV secretion system protein B4, partial [Vibrio artabrorum]
QALLTLEPRYLNQDARHVSSQDWDARLATGDIELVTIEGVTYLKLSHQDTVYARIAAVQGVGMTHTPECAWASDARPVSEKGNYLFFTRFAPYSKQQKRAMLKGEEDALFRSQTRFTDLIKGDVGSGAVLQRLQANPHLNAVLNDLDRISRDDDKYGSWLSYVVVFDTDRARLDAQVKTLNAL